MHVTFTVAPFFTVFVGVPTENVLTAGWSDEIKIKGVSTRFEPKFCYFQVRLDEEK